MWKLLKIEWMKVKNYRTFWILLGIIVISIPAFNYSFFTIHDNSFPKVKGKNILGSPFAFPDVWQTVSYNASLLFLIPALLIITLVTNEFVYKTHRQNIIDGLSRRQFIHVKLFEILLLSIFSTIIVFLTGLVFGFIVNHPDPGIDPWQNFRFVGFYFVQMISYSLIALLLSIFIKRAGLTLGIFMLYLLIENMIVGISTNLYHTTWAYYLPEETTDRLIPQPYLKAIRTAADNANWEHHIPIYLGLAALYATIYCVVVTRRFLRSDL